MYWGGEAVNEIAVNQGRRNIIGGSSNNLGSSAKTSSSFVESQPQRRHSISGPNPLFEYKVVSFNPNRAKYLIIDILFCF